MSGVPKRAPITFRRPLILALERRQVRVQSNIGEKSIPANTAATTLTDVAAALPNQRPNPIAAAVTENQRKPFLKCSFVSDKGGAQIPSKPPTGMIKAIAPTSASGRANDPNRFRTTFANDTGV